MTGVTPGSIAVIGAGIIGAATARELQRRFPNTAVTVLDKAAHPAAHQSGHNSGVVHAGLYYEPGSLKARLCRRGVDLLSDYARAKRLPYEACGKLVAALGPWEHERLENIYQRAQANGVPNVELLGTGAIRQLEPNATGSLALYSPHTAITDFAAITRALIDDVRNAGGTLRFNTEVSAITQHPSGVTLRLAHTCGAVWHQTFDHVVACAGLQSDRVARLAGGAKYPVIIPFFGQYARLAPAHRKILRGLVYPVPDPAYPFLGVHLTKRVDGEMLVGPNAFLSLGRQNYSGWRINVRDTFQTLATGGFWKFAARNLPAAAREFSLVVSHQRFLGAAAAYVPALAGASAVPITRGIRAQAMDAAGRLVDDFVIDDLGRVTVLRNAPSPGATSSFAIAEHLVQGLVDRHGLTAR